MTKHPEDHELYKFSLPKDLALRLRNACALVQIKRTKVLRMFVEMFCDEIEANEKAGTYAQVLNESKD